MYSDHVAGINRHSRGRYSYTICNASNCNQKNIVLLASRDRVTRYSIKT